MWPREHGAWAVLIAPILVGFAAAGGGPPAGVAAFVAAAFGGFCLRVPLQSLASPRPAAEAPRFAAAFGVPALLGGAVLLAFYERWALLLFGVPAAAMLIANIRANLAHRTFSFANEAAGVLTLSLGAPAAYYAATGGLGREAWEAWALSSLYFLGPIFHVKLAALQHRAAAAPALRPEVEEAVEATVYYHTAAVVVVGAAVVSGILYWPALVPFAAALVKTCLRGAAPPGRVDFRRLGFQEVGWSLLFASAVAAALLSAA